MILGFKDRFVTAVEVGKKRHTIRSGKRWKVGDVAYLYEKVQTKQQRLLYVAPVTQVDDILIEKSEGCSEGLVITVNESRLTAAATNRLLKADGFRDDPLDAFDFFRASLPLDGQLIHWDYENRRHPCCKCGASSLTSCACG